MNIKIEKISSKFLVSFEGIELTPNLKELITKYKVLGFVIKESNIENSMQLFHLIKNIKSLADYPIYIAMDLSKITENSPIYRDLSYLPPLVSLVASGDSEHLIKYMDTLVSFYNKMGINLDLSLQGTIFPYTSSRSLYSFGENLENIMKFTSRYLELLQENDIQTGVWGFPGDGDSVFVENKMATNNYTLEELNNELLIYQSMINSNVSMISVSSHLFNYIDNGKPAFTSEIIVDKLTKDMEYHSLVMGNVTSSEIMNKFRFDDIIDLSLKSGIDILYIENGVNNLNKYLEKLELRFDMGGFDTKKLENSYEKIVFSRTILETFSMPHGEIYLEDDEKDVIVKDTFSEQLCEDSIFIFEANKKTLPLKLEEYDLVAVVEPEEITSNYISEGAETDSFSFSQYCKDIFNASYQVIADDKTKWEDFKQIIYCVNSKSKSDLKNLQQIQKYKIPITLVSTKGLDLFDFYSDIYCSKVVSFGFNEFQKKALAKVLFGEYENKAINPFKM